MTSEQAVFLRDVVAQQLADEQNITSRVIAALPEANLGYRPDPKAKSAIELAWHLAAAEVFFLDSVAAGDWANPAKRPEDVKTAAAVVAWYEQHAPAALEKVKSLSGDQLTKVMDFRGLFQQPAVGFTSVALRHAIHHRGELVTYIRPMGGKVPSVYGPSGDEEVVKR